MGRISICPKTGLKRGAWTPEEDRLLAAYISRYGHWNWRELPKYAGLSRCGKSCRLRWKNYLHPHIKRGNYSKDEEELIMRMHQKLGNRWSAIAACLPGRTDNEIKNYWHTHLKKRTEESTSSNGGRQTLKKYETPENKAQVQNFIETIAPAILNLESAIVLPPSPQNAGDCSFSSADSDASMRPIPQDSSVLSFAESFLEGDLYVPEYPSPLFSLSPVNEFLHAYDMLDGYGMDVFPSLTSPYSNNHILDSWL